MFVKVGVALNVHRRLKSYLTHCPIPFSTGFRAALPTVKRAKQLEAAILGASELSGYRSQGEWFVVLAGPLQHVHFIKDLLATLYIERFRDKTIWGTRLEWVISPNDERISEIPGADADCLCGVEDGGGLQDLGHYEQDSKFWVKAESQAEALGRLIYPEMDDQ